MKFILSIITLSFLSLNAFANYDVVDCSSIRGTNRDLVLILASGELRQVRVTNGGRPHSLIPTKVLNQNIEGITLYTLNGALGFMQVENQIFAGNGGFVRLLDDEFSCI